MVVSRRKSNSEFADISWANRRDLILQHYKIDDYIVDNYLRFAQNQFRSKVQTMVLRLIY